jgi:hypothetical protein
MRVFLFVVAGIAAFVVMMALLGVPHPAPEVPIKERVEAACAREWPGNTTMQDNCATAAYVHDISNNLAESQRRAERDAGIR